MALTSDGYLFISQVLVRYSAIDGCHLHIVVKLALLRRQII